MQKPVLNEQAPMQPLPFRIIAKKQEITGCTTFTVKPSGGAEGTHFAPGQFYMIYVFGHGEVPISVSGDAEVTDTLTFTIMDVGSVTHALCALEPESMIGLRGPFGSDWPIKAAEGKDLLLIAGGLGLAPLRPAIYHARHHRERFNSVTVLYGTRTPESLLFGEQYDEWQEDGLHFKVTVDSATREWHGHVGVVTDLIKEMDLDPANTVAMTCGPEVMMRFTAFALLDKGVAPNDIYVSMERNMKCALGFCGRCQYGPHFICKDGPVFPYDVVERLFKVREV